MGLGVGVLVIFIEIIKYFVFMPFCRRFIMAKIKSFILQFPISSSSLSNWFYFLLFFMDKVLGSGGDHSIEETFVSIFLCSLLKKDR